MQVWLIPLANETQGVQVKQCYPLTMCAIPERLRDVSCIGAIQIDITFIELSTAAVEHTISLANARLTYVNGALGPNSQLCSARVMRFSLWKHMKVQLSTHCKVFSKLFCGSRFRKARNFGKVRPTQQEVHFPKTFAEVNFSVCACLEWEEGKSKNQEW